MTGNHWPRRVLAMCACLLMGVAEARTLAEVRASGELRICVAGSSAPFYQRNGEAFARYLGVRTVVVPLADWDMQFRNADGVTIIEAGYEAGLLANGQCDIFPNDLHMTDWRKTKMLLVPYYSTRKMVVAHRDMRPVLKGPADLAGRRAVVQKGTAYESWLQQGNDSVFKSHPVVIDLAPTHDSMKRVAERGAEFTIIGAESAFKWVRSDLENLDLLFPVDDAVEVGWGMRPSAQDLREQLERFFADNLRVGSDLDRAWQKQYGISLMEYRLFESSFGTAGIDFKEIMAWGLPLGSGVLGILVAMLFWTRRLNHAIAEHQRTEAELRASRKVIERESARRLAVAQISMHLQEASTREDFGRALLSSLAGYMPIGQAIFSILDHDGQLHALAHYAGNGISPEASLRDFPTTGGLIQRCIDTREVILVDAPGVDYLRLRSGLFEGAPAAILLFPVLRLQHLCGILEIATLLPVNDDHLRLLKELEPVIALSLNVLQQREKPA